MRKFVDEYGVTIIELDEPIVSPHSKNNKFVALLPSCEQTFMLAETEDDIHHYIAEWAEDSGLKTLVQEDGKSYRFHLDRSLWHYDEIKTSDPKATTGSKGVYTNG